MKRIDLYLLKSLLGLLVATFVICIFILLMQFAWMHVKDLVGKGVEVSVLAEFFLYACATMTPMALPLSILLASLITFGNLSEKSELTAMKAAGISLFRIFRPLVVACLMISVGAFYFSNNILPKSQVKLWALIFSLRQKSPELDIPVGEFYDGIGGINMRVGSKNMETGMLYDVKLYDYSKGFQNATMLLCDSARLYFTEDKHYLLFDLYRGESFENIESSQQRATKSQRNIPYRREQFAQKQILIDFSTEFSRYSESVLDDQHVSKNTGMLIQSIDSVAVLAQVRAKDQSSNMVASKYLGRETRPGTILVAPEDAGDKRYNLDELLGCESIDNQRHILQWARDRANQMKDVIDYNAIMMEEHLRYIRKHAIELHRRFTLSFACLIFFFIGAPLGAIIRKGGLGAPTVISVVIFIIYYIIDNTGYKMAREAIWPVWQGMWLSSMVLLPVGIFMTYKAATDSALFNPEVWVIRYQKLKQKIQQWIQSRKQLRTSVPVKS